MEMKRKLQKDFVEYLNNHFDSLFPTPEDAWNYFSKLKGSVVRLKVIYTAHHKKTLGAMMKKHYQASYNAAFNDWIPK